jgi:hypothetical protein
MGAVRAVEPGPEVCAPVMRAPRLESPSMPIKSPTMGCGREKRNCGGRIAHSSPHRGQIAHLLRGLRFVLDEESVRLGARAACVAPALGPFIGLGAARTTVSGRPHGAHVVQRDNQRRAVIGHRLGPPFTQKVGAERGADVIHLARHEGA